MVLPKSKLPPIVAASDPVILFKLTPTVGVLTPTICDVKLMVLPVIVKGLVADKTALVTLIPTAAAEMLLFVNDPPTAPVAVCSSLIPSTPPLMVTPVTVAFTFAWVVLDGLSSKCTPIPVAVIFTLFKVAFAPSAAFPKPASWLTRIAPVFTPVIDPPVIIGCEFFVNI